MSSSRTLLFIFIGIGVVIISVILIVSGVLPGKRAVKQSAATIEFWGFEDEQLWRPILTSFRETFPLIIVNYRRVDESVYEETLLNRLAEGRGPDVFVLKNTWIEKHRDKIYPLPQEAFNFNVHDFKPLFVDMAGEELVSEAGAILGAPLFIDSLALFYNKDVFNSAGIATPPTTWDALVSISTKLTKLSRAGDVIESGIALGTFENIEHAFEIISALMLQNGDSIITTQRGGASVSLQDPAVEAMAFYTSFANPNKKNFSWSPRLKNSVEAFAEGKTAMMFGFTEDRKRVLNLNPHFNLGVAPFPQLSNATRPITFGRYYFPTVSRLSKNPYAAWQLALYLSVGRGAEMYSALTRLPPARRDMLDRKPPEEQLNAFWKQPLIAKSWPVPDDKYARLLFKEAIESVVNRSSDSPRAVERLGSQLELLLRQAER